MPDPRLILALALVAILGVVLVQRTPIVDSVPMMAPSEERTDRAHAHDESSPEDGHHAPSSTDDAERETSVHVVRMVTTDDGGYHFRPHVVRLEPGETVRWELASGAHTTTAYHPANGDRPARIPEGAEPWHSEFLTEEGRTTFERTFTVEGVYDYFCIPHEGYGMVGTLVVGEAHAGPGLSEPASILPDAARAKIRELNESVRSGSSSTDHQHGE